MDGANSLGNPPSGNGREMTPRRLTKQIVDELVPRAADYVEWCGKPLNNPGAYALIKNSWNLSIGDEKGATANHLVIG